MRWADIGRLIALLNLGTVLPSAMLRKLAAYERQNQFDLALRKIGRVEQILFMLDCWKSGHNPPMTGEYGRRTL